MNILLAIDGSENATAAKEFLCHFPIPDQSKVTLVSVIDNKNLTEGKGDKAGADQREALNLVQKSLYSEAEQLLEGQAKQLKAAGLDTTTKVFSGHPANEIIEFSKELKADLIVVGSCGMTGFKHLLLGSVSEKILQHAPCSVLIVKEPTVDKSHSPQQTRPSTQEGKKEDWQLLLAYDDSSSSKKAAQLCASLPLTETDDITLLTVIPLVTIYRQDIRQHINAIWRQKKQDAQKALENVASMPGFSALSCSTLLKEGPDVSEVITDTIDDLKSDIVILGQKGKSGIEKFFLGSVTEKVAKQAKCSVLVVR